MNKEEFIKLIKDYQKQEKVIDKLADIGFDTLRFPLVQSYYELYSKLLYAYFTDIEVDWIYWWLLERDGNPDMKAWDENTNEIPFDTVEDLWNFINDKK